MTHTVQQAARAAVLTYAALSVGSVAFAQAQRSGAQSTAASKSKADADAAEYRAYRLSMPVLTKVEAATRTFATTIKSDPNYKALLDASLEYEALDSKEPKTAADHARMAELKKKLGASPFGDASSVDQSLDEAEAEIAKMPPMANALKASGVAPREYVKFVGVLMQAYIVSAARAGGGQPTTPDAQIGAAIAGGLFGVNLAPENVKFVTANRAAVDRFMETMQELGKP